VEEQIEGIGAKMQSLEETICNSPDANSKWGRERVACLRNARRALLGTRSDHVRLRFEALDSMHAAAFVKVLGRYVDDDLAAISGAHAEWDLAELQHLRFELHTTCNVDLEAFKAGVEACCGELRGSFAGKWTTLADVCSNVRMPEGGLIPRISPDSLKVAWNRSHYAERYRTARANR